MRKPYRVCEICKCSLDPGEGRICDECSEKINAEQDLIKEINRMVLDTDCRQIEMEDFLNEYN